MKILSLAVLFCSIVVLHGYVSKGGDLKDDKQSPLQHKLMKLRPDAVWKQIAAVPLHFSAGHPQGMVKIGDYFFMTSVKVKKWPKKYAEQNKEYDRDAGEGVGHLYKFDKEGKLLSDITLGEGDIYHPGGIDFDGKNIWIPVAEYRPDSRAIIYNVDPVTMKVTEILRCKDHIGAVVYEPSSRMLTGMSWGAGKFYKWNLKNREPKVADFFPPLHAADNKSLYINYQDCHYIGNQLMLCSGLGNYKTAEGKSFSMGGFDIISLKDYRPVSQLPINLWSPSGRIMTSNPFWVEETATGLRTYFVPDDDGAATLFIYEVNI
ncbi:DUF6454 family protein [Dyadobacter sp. LHD-138]|uniref:DUF6454 family protein n=1 Tax=Dyadobacter sp. LHD-138 TaxID=3071413 RepID=UPI0027DF1187|nr:DUF6454 family protein [Dyadobacter sp. LHD-138]MDQ6479045.1 DUF6454 family protein [Dyadobacter sp. LHD-138]